MIKPSPEIQHIRKREYSHVVLQSSRRQLPQPIEYVGEKSGQTVIKFVGVDDIGAALKIVGYDVCLAGAVRSRAAASGPAGLVGFAVRDVAGGEWGEVAAVQDSPRNPLLEIRPAAGGAAILVPFQEAIVRRVDRRRRLIVIDAPAGLKELNR